MRKMTKLSKREPKNFGKWYRKSARKDKIWIFASLFLSKYLSNFIKFLMIKIQMFWVKK